MDAHTKAYVYGHRYGDAHKGVLALFCFVKSHSLQTTNPKAKCYGILIVEHSQIPIVIPLSHKPLVYIKQYCLRQRAQGPIPDLEFLLCSQPNHTLTCLCVGKTACHPEMIYVYIQHSLRITLLVFL